VQAHWQNLYMYVLFLIRYGFKHEKPYPPEMRNILKIVIFMISGICSGRVAKSQDLALADPTHCVVLNDTANVRMVMITLHPGEKLTEHSHPLWMAYCLTEGKMSETYEGKSSTFTLTPGMHVMGKPMGAHTDENVGNSDIRFLLIEIRESVK
jgi:quercetin dioxygenase-like cupin family protein